MSEVPGNISREPLLQAIEEIRRSGVPSGAQSTIYDVVFEGERFPPKLVVSIANRFANGEDLDRQTFGGGPDKPAFRLLERHGFTIERKVGQFESGYQSLRRQFLVILPEFSGFGSDERYLERERRYKNELIGLFQSNVLPLLEPEQWSDAGQAAARLLFQPLESNDKSRPQNIVGWRYAAPLKKLNPQSAAHFGQAIASLVSEEESLDKRIEDFTQALGEVTGDESFPSPAASRSLTSFYLTLADPGRHLFLKTTEISKAVRKFEPTFRWSPQGLTGEDIRKVEALSAQILDYLKDEGWEPLDLVDVQGFLWITTSYDEPIPPPGKGEISRPGDPPSPVQSIEPLNQILYGPPGTGKTFHTVNKALKILDPEFLSKNAGDRPALKARFEQLRAMGRIGMVTFHQSFAYEDFVEGLRASANDDGQIRYDVETGIFKSMCDAARSKAPAEDCFLAGQEFGRGYKVREVTPDILRLTRPNGGRLGFDMEVLDELAVLVREGKISVEDIRDENVFEKAQLDLDKHLLHGNSNILHLLVEHIVNNESASPVPRKDGADAFVLIIDEINRGNIPNIFGELITLIETSKRDGAAECTEVKLPYSKGVFSVPSNLYIVGTMNTADRSLVHMDTALRRRFVFEAMMPDTTVLSDHGVEDVEGIEVVTMLETLNQRIELLYDREHTLGHSFFLPLAESSTIDCLADIFDRQILPLLEEYFFEDWSKIRQVLGDDQKSDESTCFLVPTHTEASIQKLLASDVPEDLLGRTFERNEAAFRNPSAYRLIYQRDEV